MRLQPETAPSSAEDSSGTVRAASPQRLLALPVMWRALAAILIFGSIAALVLVQFTEALAQSDAPDTPTNVAVYIFASQQLEVRWSSSATTTIDSFKIQWKSGTEDFDSSRQMTSGPSTTTVALQSNSEVKRHSDIITGLTDGTEYTVRVIATNTNGDSDASDEKTGTPTAAVHNHREQAGEFIENEVVELFESSHPWIRETWDYVTSEGVQVRFHTLGGPPTYGIVGNTLNSRVLNSGQGGYVHLTCTERNLSSDQLELNEPVCSTWLIQIGRYDDNIVHTITHELAHVYTLSTPGPLGVAHLYLHDLVSPPGVGGRACRPNELYADALSILVHGEGIIDQTTYWGACELVTSTVSDEALGVVRSAVAGDMPSWFDDTYDDSNGDPELERVWADIKAIAQDSSFHSPTWSYEDGMAAVFQMKDSFGGYCSNRHATESALGSRVTRNPWKDGGCVPGAPRSLSATPGAYLWLTTSWQEPIDDGGSPIEGYKVQWKYGTQEYDSSRQELVTDLIFRDNRKFSFLVKEIWLSDYRQSHTVRVMAYNQNGDGAATEITATPIYSTRDTTPPRLLRAQLFHDNSAVRLIYDEELDDSSAPPRTAFTVYVNGVATQRAGLQAGVWDEVNRTHLVSFTFSPRSLPGGLKPGDVVTVSYIVPAKNPIKDAAGNLAAAFSNVEVHNDQTSYAFTSDPGTDKTYIWNNGAGEQDVIEATVTFGYPVIVTGRPELRLAIGGIGTTVWRRMPYHSGSGTNSLVFRYPVREGDIDKDGILLAYLGSLATDHGVVRYASTNAEAPAWIRGKHSADHRVDAVRATLVSADILADGTDLDLRFDKALDGSSAPTTSDPGFEVRDTSDDSVRDISSISIEGRVVTLTMATSVSATDQLTVSYEIPSSNPVKDAVGNYADDFTGDDTVSVSVTTSANSAPEFPTTEDGARSVDENSPAGRNIGAPVAATDADNDARTYSISGDDAALFEVVSTSGQLRTKEPLDHESQASYSFTMSVHDGKDLHGNEDTTADDTFSVTVTVTDVDDPPRITGPTYKERQEESSTNVATYTASDQDEPATQWALSLSGPDSGEFTLDGSGLLAFNEVPDFENPTDANGDGRYQVTITASEQGGGTRTVSLDVTIWVWNVDEGATLVWNSSTLRVGHEISLELVDPDGVHLIQEWRWERSPDQSDWTVIEGVHSSTYTPTADDENHYLRITVFYHDRHQWGKGYHYVTTATLDVGPFFDTDTATASAAENSAEDTLIGQYQAGHSTSSAVLSYSLTGGDTSYFSIDANGQLKTSAIPLDYETGPGKEAVVEITARDNNGRTDTIDVTITVTNECVSAGEPPCAPGPPSVSSLSTSSLKVSWSAPGTPSGTSIDGYELQYRESGSDGNWISESVTGTDRSHIIENLIEGTTYEVQVRASNDTSGYGEWSESGTGTPGYVAPPPVITRDTTDDGGGGGGGGFAALLAPVNNEPSFIGGTRTTRTVPEDAEPGADVGNPVAATDTDGDDLTYSLHGEDAGFFTVLAGTGQLRVNAALDFEARQTYSLEVQADDGKGGVDTIQVTVTVTNVNEPPVVTGPANPEYAENGAGAVASYTASDPEGGEMAWSLAGEDAGVFSLSATGTLAFDMPPDYETPEDADADNRYLLTVQATDAGGVLGALNVEVVVTDEQENMAMSYDSDGDGVIDREEVIEAAFDYFQDLITKDELYEVVNTYFGVSARLTTVDEAPA